MIVTTIYECQKCIKGFHKSCASINKVYNNNNELVKCNGLIRERINETVNNNDTKEITNVKLVHNEKSNKGASKELDESLEHNLDVKLNEVLGKLDDINKNRDEIIMHQVSKCKTEIVRLRILLQ